MSTLFYTTTDDGPGPIVVDHTDELDYVVHGAYGIAELADFGHVHVTFTWTESTPFEVSMILTSLIRGQIVVWPIARELLRDGGGEGDVHVIRLSDGLHVIIADDENAMTIRLDTTWIRELLRATDDIVPADTEWDQVSFPDTSPFDGGES